MRLLMQTNVNAIRRRLHSATRTPRLLSACTAFLLIRSEHFQRHVSREAVKAVCIEGGGRCQSLHHGLTPVSLIYVRYDVGAIRAHAACAAFMRRRSSLVM